MQTLRLSLAANETKQFDIGGSYFEIIDGVGAVDINFTDRSGSRAKDLEMLGALPGYFVAGSFMRFEVKNTLAQAQFVTVLYGNGVGGSRRIQGVVAVQDTARASSIADAEVFAAFAVPAPGAGIFASAEFWNASPDKGLSIRSLSVVSDTTQTVQLGGVTAELAFTGQGPLSSKRMSAAGITTYPLMHRNTKNTSVAADNPTAFLGNLNVTLNTRLDLPLLTPIIVGPGAGFRLANQAANSSLAIIINGEVFAWYG